MTATVLVDARGGARQVECLAMKCDPKEIPEFLSGAKPQGWWLVGAATFGGRITPGGETGDLGEPKDGVMKGTAAVAVGEGRVIGIMSPASSTASTIWWSWPLTELKVEVSGSQGLLKKRPAAIALHLNGGVDQDGDTIVLKQVGQLFRSSNRMQSGQEGSLLTALGS